MIDIPLPLKMPDPAQTQEPTAIHAPRTIEVATPHEVVIEQAREHNLFTERIAESEEETATEEFPKLPVAGPSRNEDRKPAHWMIGNVARRGRRKD